MQSVLVQDRGRANHLEVHKAAVLPLASVSTPIPIPEKLAAKLLLVVRKVAVNFATISLLGAHGGTVSR
jgi:hypothetical protein